MGRESCLLYVFGFLKSWNRAFDYFIFYLVRAEAIKIQQLLLHLQDHIRGLSHSTIPLILSMSRIQSISSSCVGRNTHDPSPISALYSRRQKLKPLLPAIKNEDGRSKNAGRWNASPRGICPPCSHPPAPISRTLTTVITALQFDVYNINANRDWGRMK